MDLPGRILQSLAAWIQATPVYVLLALAVVLILTGLLTLFALLHLVAPKPRAPFPSEKTYLTSSPDGAPTAPRPLPCWYDRWLAERRLSEQQHGPSDAADPTTTTPDSGTIDPAELRLSVVLPAYNEEDRILPTLEEAVAYLDAHVGRPGTKPPSSSSEPSPRKQRRRRAASELDIPPAGYEIIVVNDGSRDKTVDVALRFARDRQLHDVLRVVSLEKNRGKGGGVTHGLRHVRGHYVLFADADGATRFSDVGKLIEGCEEVVDASGRGVAIGSRAHLVGSEAVVKVRFFPHVLLRQKKRRVKTENQEKKLTRYIQRSALRNFLMRSFHLVLTILTPPATSRLRDTQCGFKLFTRAALPHIVPYMHAEGWIFDIEMLMLAESAPAAPLRAADGTVLGTSPGIKVAEVPVAWHEVGGSKLNVVQDSVRMAVGLAVLRASWMLGVYRRRLT
ncbi:dolichyl-phosphate beta-glucosyltransferase, putative [Cordyceps militaris CM01]|uniref:dolichyl-phosphate beta-glucosyltransferase n=1 Tax=Cordyceps militaris (strain CM01) TaxID=983644 RepID=G3JM39_CORMM|nr:dolichyl-phosphate beta-glucosyltransferase, putative [Cordyceps militaris CM01]EGX90763.1 dolichyl-phosphate beta-glucosyltransferase, putative [Cordyceps militaris CM01]